jgi:hypothetical protein
MPGFSLKKITFKSSPLKPMNQVKPNLASGPYPLSKMCLTDPPSIQDACCS